MLALFLADLAERLADVLLELGLVLDPLHDQLARPAADTTGVLFDRVDGAFTQRGLAHHRVLNLAQPLFLGAGQHVAPRTRNVVEVPVLEREGKAGTHGATLSEDRESLGAQTFDKGELLAMNLRIAVAG